MNISTQYARALYELVGKNEKDNGKYLKNLRQALERRGHVKLALANERTELHKKITPENEQTRMLLELYRKLTASSP